MFTDAKPGIRNAFLTMPGNWAHTLYVLIMAPEDIFSVGFVSWSNLPSSWDKKGLWLRQKSLNSRWCGETANALWSSQLKCQTSKIEITVSLLTRVVQFKGLPKMFLKLNSFLRFVFIYQFFKWGINNLSCTE